MNPNTRARRGARKQDVWDAICELGKELSTPPDQARIAEYVGINQQHVSQIMQILHAEGRIEWITRYTYRVINAAWEAPPDS